METIKRIIGVIIVIVLFIFCILTIAGVFDEDEQQFNTGDTLLPDYVHTDTLIILKDFTLPDSLLSDKEINDYINLYSETLKNL